VHGLALRGFDHGIWFTAVGRASQAPLPSQKTFANNTVSAVTLTEITQAGIWLDPVRGRTECDATACRTQNRWVDIRIVGNTIMSSGKGIEVELQSTFRETVERLTIEGNKITLAKGASFAINLSAGGGGGADQNRISNVTVADNSIEAVGHAFGINVFSGLLGGSTNLVEDLRIERNRIHYSSPLLARGIHIAMSDGCTQDRVCSKGNVARGIQVVGNVIEGTDEAGILASYPCCGPGTFGELTDVRIAENVIKGVVTSDHPHPWGIVLGTGATNVSNVVVDSNTIEQRTIEPGARHAAYLAAGGIAILGGLGNNNSTVRSISVTNNRIDTDLPGITIVGGGPDPYRDNYFGHEVTGNAVSGVTLRGNVIGRAPTLVTRWDAGIKGISVIGGIGPAPGSPPQTVRGNSVDGVRVENNMVAGVIDDVSVRSNFGQGVSGNTAALAPGTASGETLAPTPTGTTAGASPSATPPSVAAQPPGTRGNVATEGASGPGAGTPLPVLALLLIGAASLIGFAALKAIRR
jgi:hypothetical protein